MTSEKRWKQNQNRPINRDTLLIQTMSPWMKSAPASEYDKQKNKQTRNQKHHSNTGDNAYQQDIVTFICSYTWAELITISVVTVRSIWHNSAADFLHFEKFSPHISESYGAIYWRNCKMFSALQGTYGPLTQGENSVQINAKLATLSFLKVVKMINKFGSEFSALMWRHLMLQKITVI